jgi:hypothetical protein
MIWDIRRAFLFLYRWLFKRRHATSQPIPRVTEQDVARIVRRDFAENQSDAVMRVLNAFGAARSEGGRGRVHLAALKLANGNLDALKAQIEIAREDYRDVLAPAEYSEYSERPFQVRDLPVGEQQRIIANDWKQYEEWLRR